MNILFASGYNPFQKGSGPSIGLYYLSKSMANIGCDIHILTPQISTSTQIGSRITIHNYNNPLKRRLYSDSWIPFSFFSVRQINELCRQYDFDIIIGNSPTSFAYALMRDAKAKQPFVVWAHGTSFGELSSLYQTPSHCLNSSILREAGAIMPIWTFFCNIEYNFADKIMAVSKATAKEIISYYRVDPQNIAVIHNGVDIIDAQEERAVEYLILSAGRMTWRKGFFYLINAMKEVLNQFPKAKLILVGDGPYRQKLVEQVSSLNLQKHVIFTGAVSRKELLKLYFNAQIYVQPSLYEPLGNTVLEAMAAERPVIATRVGGIPEIIRNQYNGVLVEPYDSLALAQAIKTLFLDSAYANELGKKAKFTVTQSFSWKLIAQQTLALCKDCLL